ncbi:MAG: D-2-hydroxyacid dehydrogenase [Chloroflexi bacterium]|nr:D-2-hydroxyacid dehydrogenase [Chloroflexota bacterium]
MKIVLAWRPDADRLADLQAAHPEVEFLCPEKAEDLAELVADADGYFGNISPEVFAAARRLRWVQAGSAGVEFLWRAPALVESDVVVTNMRGAHAATIAEHAFALLLYFTRGLPAWVECQREHRWNRPGARGSMESLVGKTMGIVGLGRIGSAIARRAAAFEMRVLAVDTQPVSHGPEVQELRGLDGLHAMLKQTDVLTISAPITPETRGLIGPAELELLQPGSYLIAVSRGGIVNQEALIVALRAGRLAAVGLDVTDPEPLPADSPLWGFPNVLITPHTSGASRVTTENVWQLLSENISRFIRGEELANVVNKRLGY